MNLLLLAPHPFYQHRGTPLAVKQLSKVLADNGHLIHILTYHEGENIDIPNVEIHRIPRLPGIKNILPGPSWKKFVCDMFLFGISLKLIRRYRFDLIHAVEESAFLGIILRLLFRIPFVYDMDSSLSEQMIDKYHVLRPFRSLLETLEGLAIKRSIGVVAVCKHLENIALKKHPSKRVVRLEDISLLQLEVQNEQCSVETLDLSGTIIMYVGNLAHYQGIDLLLRGFKLVVDKAQKAHLVIIGGSETDLRFYRGVASELGIGHKTHFLGPKPTSQLPSFLKQAHILVSPRTKGTNTPMKIYSYLDSGRPVLATRLPTHTQVLDDKIALLVAPKPEAISAGLILLINDSVISKNLATEARKRVKKNFCYQAFKKKLSRFYENLEEDLIGSGNSSQ